MSAARHLAAGATVEPKGHGVSWLVLDGRWVMTVTAATLAAAQREGGL